MEACRIRPAVAADLSPLTAIALRAKASWGYDQAFMEACRAELTLTPGKFARRQVWVAENGPDLVGLISLTVRAHGRWAEVEEFFVDPPWQGRGVGRALFDALVAAGRAQGIGHLEVSSDPFAEGVYLQLGFITIGRAPSASFPGRWLPRLSLELGG